MIIMKSLTITTLNSFSYFVLSFLIFLLFSSETFAQTANGSVDPNPATAEVGQTFVVDVNIDPNGSGLTAAQIAMSYDQSIVEVSSVMISTASELGIPLPGTTIDNVEGFFFIAGFGFAPAVNSFTHVEIEFTALANGTSPLDFETEGVLATLFSAAGSSVTGDLTSGEIIIGTAVDCPLLGLNIGDTCDDLDSDTENDTVLADCSCAGTPICAAPFPAVNEASLTTVIGPSTVDFGWDAVSGQIGCQVQVVRAQPPLPYPRQSFVVLEPTVNSFSINTNLVIPGITHAWRVRCGCSASPIVAGPFSSYQTFLIPSQIALTSSPNPTQDISNVVFKLETESHATLEVYDMNGRLVEQVFSGMASSNTPYRFQFDGSDLSQGIYIYRLTTNDEVINEKFMISK